MVTIYSDLKHVLLATGIYITNSALKRNKPRRNDARLVPGSSVDMVPNVMGIRGPGDIPVLEGDLPDRRTLRFASCWVINYAHTVVSM